MYSTQSYAYILYIHIPALYASPDHSLSLLRYGYRIGAHAWRVSALGQKRLHWACCGHVAAVAGAGAAWAAGERQILHSRAFTVRQMLAIALCIPPHVTHRKMDWMVDSYVCVRFDLSLLELARRMQEMQSICCNRYNFYAFRVAWASVHFWVDDFYCLEGWNMLYQCTAVAVQFGRCPCCGYTQIIASLSHTAVGTSHTVLIKFIVKRFILGRSACEIQCCVLRVRTESNIDTYVHRRRAENRSKKNRVNTKH